MHDESERDEGGITMTISSVMSVANPLIKLEHKILRLKKNNSDSNLLIRAELLSVYRMT